MSTTLPPELILHCLIQLDPTCPTTLPTLLSVSLASRALNDLSRANILWRPLLEAHYTRQSRTSTTTSSTTTATKTSYETYRNRATKDERAKSIVGELQNPLNRIPLIRELRRDLGSDVVEVLAKAEEPSSSSWCSIERRPETYLSLRYWAREARKAILRDEAVKTWEEIVERNERGEEGEDDFERGVNAFGAFRGLDPELLDRDRYSTLLHPSLLEVIALGPSEPTKRLEWIANRVCDHMLTLGLRSANSGTFHNLDNHYVELVFLKGEDESFNTGTLPMTLVSIFCSFVRRLPNCQDIEVRPVGFPGTVMAGMRVRSSGEDWVYVNPFANPRARLPSRQAMNHMLNAMGLTPEPSFFRPASALEMCTRVSRNILTSIQHGQSPSQQTGISCLYSVAHSLLALTSSTTLPTADNQLPGIDWLTSIVQAEYPQLDQPFLTDRVLPLLRRHHATSASIETGEKISEVEGLIQALEESDVTPKDKKWKTEEIEWRIGHVFKHRLFGYYAVVRGWDETCKASETWIRQMQVDRLPFGRNQPFYHVIVADGSTRYVAQENITTSQDHPIPRSIVERFVQDETVGRYFRTTRVVGGGEGEGEEQIGGGEGRIAFVKSWENEAEYPDS